MEHSGNFLVPLALLGWIPVVALLFTILPPRTAVLYSFLLSWLFLPMASIGLHPFTDYNKMVAASVGTLVASLIFDTETIFSFRPRLWDLPMAIWCAAPFFSSIQNGLGAYDGFNGVVYAMFDWGLPYFIGRIYFNDLQGLRELAVGIAIGGLIYVPLCWLEIRLSPQLHMWVYGFHQHDFDQTRRDGSYRPMVFMQHGLAVALWMGAATLCAFWLWRTKTVPRIAGLPCWLAFLILLITTYFCHSMGATLLCLACLIILVLTEVRPSPIWALLLLMVPPTYMYVRTTDIFTGKSLVQFLEKHVNEDRANSLQVRLDSERHFVDKGLKSPVFGWGGWNRFREVDENGVEMGVPDAMWIIAFGHNGWVGLVALTTAMLLPMLIFWGHFPARFWTHPGAAPVYVIALILAMHMCDCLMNAMINPVFVLGCGGIGGLTYSMRRPNPMPAQQRGFAVMPARA